MNSSLVYSDILRICSVPNSPRIFLLPTKERPSRILSQQRRALNLVHALFENGVFAERGLGVIGGGFGGLTAAAYAALQGVEVTVFERQEKFFKRFENSQRYIHPRMYDWPLEGWSIPEADLPVMNWSAGLAKKVVADLIRQFDIVKSQFHADVQLGAHINSDNIQGASDGAWVRWHNNKANAVTKKRFDALIICVGFGNERTPVSDESNKFQQYWDLKVPQLPYPKDLPKREVYSVGNGDGALADLIGLAALSDPSYFKTDQEKKDVFAGNFIPLLKKLPPDEFKNLEDIQKRRFITTGSDEPTRDYVSRVRELADGCDLPKPEIKKLFLYGRSSNVVDISGTYSANRTLFLSMYPKELVVYNGSRNVDDKLRAMSDEWFGPFNESGKNLVLQRKGPLDPLESSFSRIAKVVANPKIRSLALTERPISAAWSRRSLWSPSFQSAMKDSGSFRPQMPRLILASEWFDTPIQKLLLNVERKRNVARAKHRARDFLTGLLRLYLLLFDEVMITDAEIIDGVLLVSALDRLSPSEISRVSIRARDSGLAGSAVRFLARFDQDSSAWLMKPVQLSSVSEQLLGDPIHDFAIQAKRPQTILRKLKERHSQLASLIERTNRADEMFAGRIRLFSKFQLRSLIPQSGLLENLSAEHYESLSIPTREGEFIPSRSVVFNHLKKITGEPDPFFAETPTWLPVVTSWYNAAYNTAIGQNNGATASDILWVNPMKKTVQDNATGSTSVSLYEIGKCDEFQWSNIETKIASTLARWKRGEIELQELLLKMQPFTSAATTRFSPAKTSFKERIIAAIDSDQISVSELYNDLPDPYSASRAIVFHAGPTLISSVLIRV